MAEARDSLGRFVSVDYDDGTRRRRRRRSRSRRRETPNELSRARSIAAENRPRDRYGRFLPEHGETSRSYRPRRGRSRSRSRSRVARYPDGASVARSIEAEIRPRDALGRFLPEARGSVRERYLAEYRGSSSPRYSRRSRRNSGYCADVYSPGYAVGEFRGNTQQSAQLVDEEYGVASM